MSVVRMSAAKARKIDRAKLDATTDEEIARQIAGDPDVAPDRSDMRAAISSLSALWTFEPKPG